MVHSIDKRTALYTRLCQKRTNVTDLTIEKDYKMSSKYWEEKNRTLMVENQIYSPYRLSYQFISYKGTRKYRMKNINKGKFITDVSIGGQVCKRW